MAERWWRVARYVQGQYRGWCGHRHRMERTAQECADILNRSWSKIETGPDFGAIWTVEVVGGGSVRLTGKDLDDESDDRPYGRLPAPRAGSDAAT